MAQGFSLVDSMAGATRVYGVPVDQAYRAADSLFATKKSPRGLLSQSQEQESQSQIQQSVQPTFDSMAYEPPEMSQPPQIESVFPSPLDEGLLGAPEPYPSCQIAQAIIDSLNQGFTMDQIQQGAFNNFGLNQDQFSRAAAMLPSMGYNIGQGFQ